MHWFPPSSGFPAGGADMGHYITMDHGDFLQLFKSAGLSILAVPSVLQCNCFNYSLLLNDVVSFSNREGGRLGNPCKGTATQNAQ